MMRDVKDLIYKNESFELSLVFFGKNDDNRSKTKFDRAYVSKSDNVFIQTYRSTLLQFSGMRWDGEEKKRVKTNDSWVSTDSFNDLITAFVISRQWLKDARFKYLFEYDDRGNIVGVGSPPPFNPVVYYRSNVEKFIRFHPTVTMDRYGSKYEGIMFENQNGVIASLNNQDFLTVYLMIKSLINNYYPTVLHLMNLSTNNLIKERE